MLPSPCTAPDKADASSYLPHTTGLVSVHLCFDNTPACDTSCAPKDALHEGLDSQMTKLQFRRKVGFLKLFHGAQATRPTPSRWAVYPDVHPMCAYGRAKKAARTLHCQISPTLAAAGAGTKCGNFHHAGRFTHFASKWPARKAPVTGTYAREYARPSQPGYVRKQGQRRQRRYRRRQRGGCTGCGAASNRGTPGGSLRSEGGASSGY